MEVLAAMVVAALIFAAFMAGGFITKWHISAHTKTIGTLKICTDDPEGAYLFVEFDDSSCIKLLETAEKAVFRVELRK